MIVSRPTFLSRAFWSARRLTPSRRPSIATRAASGIAHSGELMIEAIAGSPMRL